MPIKCDFIQLITLTANRLQHCNVLSRNNMQFVRVGDNESVQQWAVQGLPFYCTYGGRE